MCRRPNPWCSEASGARTRSVTHRGEIRPLRSTRVPARRGGVQICEEGYSRGGTRAGRGRDGGTGETARRRKAAWLGTGQGRGGRVWGPTCRAVRSCVQPGPASWAAVPKPGAPHMPSGDRGGLWPWGTVCCRLTSLRTHREVPGKLDVAAPQAKDRNRKDAGYPSRPPHAKVRGEPVERGPGLRDAGTPKRTERLPGGSGPGPGPQWDRSEDG